MVIWECLIGFVIKYSFFMEIIYGLLFSRFRGIFSLIFLMKFIKKVKLLFRFINVCDFR